MGHIKAATWLISFLLLMEINADSVYITTPKGGQRSEAKNSVGPFNCVTADTMQLYMDNAQESVIEGKRISLSTYEYVRDVLTHIDGVKNMIRTVIEKEMVISTMVNEVLNIEENLKNQLPQYATNTNSRLFLIEQKQVAVQTEVKEMKAHLDARLNKLEEMIVASAGLSQNAIITYSVVVLVSIVIILVGALWFISYFAISASPDTAFIQRLTRNVWEAMMPHTLSTVTVQAASSVPEMPPSYSTVDVSSPQTTD